MSAAINLWTNTTEMLPSVKQRTIQDTLLLVQQGDIKIVYGIDQLDGRPCLINAIGAMVKDVNESPISNEQGLVTAFDAACRYLFNMGMGDEPNIVTPLMAEVLVRHFGKLQDQPEFLVELPESGISWTDVPDTVDALLGNDQG